MSGADDHETEYSEEFIAYVEAMWGEGFLSPGGPEEVAAILEGSDIGGLRVLDVGCGVGGCDLELVRSHGAAEVVGIDIEPQMVDRCRALADRTGLAGRLDFHVVEPGPFPFPPTSFDVVFSKDSMIHIPDKPALYRDVLRVLRPGGLFLASDWLRGLPGEDSETMHRWMETADLRFTMESPEKTARAMEAAGFVAVEVRNRNAWFRQQSRRDLAQLEGPAYAAVVAAMGEEGAQTMLERTALRIEIVDSGELSPCHLKGVKPT